MALLCNRKTLYTGLLPLQDNSKNNIVTFTGTYGSARMYGYDILVDDNVADGTVLAGDMNKVIGAMGEDITVREGYDIDLVRADMSKPLPFADASFDLIVHPVSNCYIEQVLPVWRECARILRPGGLLMAGLDNGVNFITDDDEERIVNHLPFNPLKNADQRDQLAEADDGVQFSHTLDEQIRGQIQAGLRIVDLYEDTNGYGRLHELGIPSFWATLAQKPED